MGGRRPRGGAPNPKETESKYEISAKGQLRLLAAATLLCRTRPRSRSFKANGCVQGFWCKAFRPDGPWKIYPPIQKGGGRRPHSCLVGIGARWGPSEIPKSKISDPMLGAIDRAQKPCTYTSICHSEDSTKPSLTREECAGRAVLCKTVTRSILGRHKVSSDEQTHQVNMCF